MAWCWAVDNPFEASTLLTDTYMPCASTSLNQLAIIYSYVLNCKSLRYFVSQMTSVEMDDFRWNEIPDDYCISYNMLNLVLFKS